MFGGSSCDINKFIKINPHTYIYIHTYIHFVIIYTHTYIFTLFYLISYTYTHTPSKEEKKKGLIFSIKIMFDGDLS